MSNIAFSREISFYRNVQMSVPRNFYRNDDWYCMKGNAFSIFWKWKWGFHVSFQICSPKEKHHKGCFC